MAPGTPHVVQSGPWTIEWSDAHATATKGDGGEAVRVFQSVHENCCSWSDERSPCPSGWFERSTHRLLSIVGPIVSFTDGYEGSGGMHPIYGLRYRAVDLDTNAPADVTQIAAERSILKALIAAPAIKAHLGDGERPSSLDELVALLGVPCETDWSALRNAFRVGAIGRKAMTIEFGLGHGCEAMRGTFTTIEIRVPIPGDLRSQVRAAARISASLPARDPYIPEPECEDFSEAECDDSSEDEP